MSNFFLVYALMGLAVAVHVRVRMYFKYKASPEKVQQLAAVQGRGLTPNGAAMLLGLVWPISIVAQIMVLLENRRG